MNRDVQRLIKLRNEVTTAEIICGADFPAEAKVALATADSFIKSNTTQFEQKELRRSDMARRKSTAGMIKSGKVKINPIQNLSDKITEMNDLMNGKMAEIAAVA